ARRGAPERLPDDPGHRDAQPRRLAAQPRLRLPRAPAAGGRGPGHRRRRGRQPLLPPDRAGPRGGRAPARRDGAVGRGRPHRAGGPPRAAPAVGPARRGVRPPGQDGRRRPGRQGQEAAQADPQVRVPDPGGGPMSEDAAVVVRRLTKTYGKTEAVKGIDFEVAPGEVFGFLGPNGAGKTTTISMLCTLANPTGGTATVAGHDVVEERDEVRRNIGLVFQDPTLDGYLSAEQNLRFHAELYGVPRGAVDARIKRVMEMVALWDRKDAKVMTFSGGMKRRLEIARGLLRPRRGLCRGAASVRLDPQTRTASWGHISEGRVSEDITIFMTTHSIDEAEDCDRIAIIVHGEIVVIDSPERLRASVGNDRVQLH